MAISNYLYFSIILVVSELIYSEDNTVHLSILSHKSVIEQRLSITEFLEFISKTYSSNVDEKINYLDSTSTTCTILKFQLSIRRDMFGPCELSYSENLPVMTLNPLSNQQPLVESPTFNYNLENIGWNCIVKLTINNLKVVLNPFSNYTSLISLNFADVKAEIVSFDDQRKPPSSLIDTIEKNFMPFRDLLTRYFNNGYESNFMKGRIPFGFILNFGYKYNQETLNLVSKTGTDPSIFENSDYILSHHSGMPATSTVSVKSAIYDKFNKNFPDEIQMFYDINMISKIIEFKNSILFNSSFFKPIKLTDIQLSLFVEDIGNIIPGIYYQFMRRQKIIISQYFYVLNFNTEPISSSDESGTTHRVYLYIKFNFTLYQANTDNKVIEFSFYFNVNLNFMLNSCTSDISLPAQCLDVFFGDNMIYDKLVISYGNSSNSLPVNSIELRKLFYNKILQAIKAINWSLFNINFGYTVNNFQIIKEGFLIRLGKLDTALKKQNINHDDL